MTKEHYFEACEALGSEPLEEEIPVELEDLPLDVMIAYGVYDRLRDTYDNFNGNYLGKDLSNMFTICKLLDIPEEEHKDILDIISLIDKHRGSVLQQALASQRAASKSKAPK